VKQFASVASEDVVIRERDIGVASYGTLGHVPLPLDFQLLNFWSLQSCTNSDIRLSCGCHATISCGEACRLRMLTADLRP